MHEELDPNDHRVIGPQLGLFHIQEEAAGSVFWHPNGATLLRTIKGYIRSRLDREGYQEIVTPQLVDRSLWEKSGHWEKFRKNMFVASDAELPLINPDPEYAFHKMDLESQRTRIAIKPMNCPCHVQVYNQRTVSYRQLPIRYAEFGCCHRNEPSGALHGIMRLRQFTQDDAHIFCTEDQVAAETEKFVRLLLAVYRDFGFTEIKIGFSTRPEQRAGTDETWDRAEDALREAVGAIGLDYETYPGEGAFYGPKLEFALVDIRGRQWQCGTLQLDFVLPERLGAQYTAASGERLRPVMIHRAILGSIERFVGILLENYEGRLPAWLAPVQYTIVPIRPEHAAYAQELDDWLAGTGLRGRVDARDEHMNNRIKEVLEERVPYLLVVGARDIENQTAALRVNGGTSQNVTREGFLSLVAQDEANAVLRAHNR